MAYDYELLGVNISGRIATVTINNPPINIITPALYQELVGLVAELKDDDSLTVIVFKSADPDFFIAHYDVSNILKFPTEGDAERNLELSDFHTMCERVRTMNKVTIAQIEGRVGGGGSEFAAFFFQAEDGIRDRSPSRGLGDVYKRQALGGGHVPYAHSGATLSLIHI